MYLLRVLLQQKVHLILLLKQTNLQLKQILNLKKRILIKKHLNFQVKQRLNTIQIIIKVKLVHIIQRTYYFQIKLNLCSKKKILQSKILKNSRINNQNNTQNQKEIEEQLIKLIEISNVHVIPVKKYMDRKDLQANIQNLNILNILNK
ncbi:hypothetical protein IMG5_158710 [Ichthyophthirius multifiliis]|uniref:Uncharacterized protein n=1 Tax=Ichthyophthirius multifiliis TaxID=5932 RepID=G0QZP6_ICHMU|nr:hypothetical protein IMG5_158710 [Ichthyophthirius multifiliis]EGR29320.1 hypothetical protein IMG5_158710 [Ichthyophthirius multifiliis]|eukprot:XP_004030556.1 hypothetical protein IMG5_158710 [Ichthyophthirius multifiliis]